MSQRIVQKPWGEFETLIENSKCTVKVLYLDGGHRTSLQYHKKRVEYHKLISGTCKLQLGKQMILLQTNHLIKIPKNKSHRITAITNTIILELSIGSFNERDIVRLQDDYNRI